MDAIKKQLVIIFFLSICFFLSQLVVNVPASNALEAYKQAYLNGLEYKKKGQYEEAIKSFDMAIKENDKEKKKIRYYGMRYGEYLPRREKGICHYMLKQYKNAVNELEASIANISTDETNKYLNLAKMELSKLKPDDLFETVQTPDELKNPKQAVAQNRFGVAVVIGNRDYKNKDIPSVNFAIQDATQVRDYLIKTFGFRNGNIIFKTNATKGVFENIFGTRETHKGMLFDYMSPGKSDVFVYYSGHGAPSLESKKGYILPVDGNPNNVSIGGYALELLYSNLAKLNAKSVTVVTDACFSGATIFKKASPVGIIVKNPLVAQKNTTIINSSAGTELSSWYPEKGHGLFTYYFLLGLNGKADINGNNQITVGELTSYVQDNVPYMVRNLHGGRKQTPSIKSLNSKKVLVRYK